MKVTLVNPPYPEKCLRDFRCQVITPGPIREILPPLALAYVAAFLRKGGMDVSIVDCIADDLSLEDLDKRIKKDYPELIVLVTSTPTFKSDVAATQRIKESFPEAKTCFFGTHVSIFPKESLHEPAVDFVAVSEAELTILELCQLLERGNTKEFVSVKGLGWKEGERIIINEKRGLIENLDELPFPARDLLPNDKYRPIIYRKLPFTTMLSSRGCPYNCIFCSSKIMFECKWRARSPGNVMDEIEAVVNTLGIREIFFNDDTFTLDKRRVLEICRQIVNSGLDVIWGCESRVDTVNRETLEVMKQAGCYKITYGVESGAQSVLDKIKKGITISQVRETFKETRRAGIQANASFIIGLPWDNLKSIETTIRFAKEIGPDHAQFCIATPYPGTDLYKIVKECGYLVKENWDLFDVHSGGVCRTADLSADELFSYMRRAYKEFYFRPQYIIRKLFNMRSWREFQESFKIFCSLISL